MNFATHVQNWRYCDRCSLHKYRKNIVLARGKLPCDILFVGEAPGESEDVLGKPFCGPAGKLLDEIIQHAFESGKHVLKLPVAGMIGSCRRCGRNEMELVTPCDKPWRIAVTNLVSCIPRAEEGGKFVEPTLESIEKCRPRLVEFAKLADPKLIVCVGKLAATHLSQDRKDPIKLHKRIPQVAITHPAAILRANEAMQGLAVKQAIVTLSNAVAEI